MGRVNEFPSEKTPLYSYAALKNPSRRRFVRNIVLVLLGAASLLASIWNSKITNSDGPIIKDFRPSGYKLLSGSGSFCSSAIYQKDVMKYKFPVGANFSIVQTIHDGEAFPSIMTVHTSGEILLRRLPKNSEHGSHAQIDVQVNASNPDFQATTSWDQESRTFKISSPIYAKASTHGPHCISLLITAWFPEGAEFSNIAVESVTLGLTVVEDINIEVKGRSIFQTVTGDIQFPQIFRQGLAHREFSSKSSKAQPVIQNGPSTTKKSKHPYLSRDIVVGTISGNINGSYPLMDLLRLSSNAGAITVDVLPQEVLQSAPAPADLEVENGSGKIDIQLPETSYLSPPLRDYITRINSIAGSISGTYYLGSISNFKSASGSINIKGTPVFAVDVSAKYVFETHAVSGSTSINMLDPIFISALASHKLRNLASTHSSNAASITVKYPDAWVGNIHARSVTGTIEAKGEGLQTIEEKKGWAHHELLARRGVDDADKGCSVEISSVTGVLDFSLGSDM